MTNNIMNIELQMEFPNASEDLMELDRLLEIEKLYYELLYQVSQKFQNETRHETALRYIRERENVANCPDCSAELKIDGNKLTFVKHNI